MSDHIRISPAGGRYVIRAGGAIIGETERALELTEGGYPPVIYVPREDVAMALLESTDRTTTCPWKGQASYFSISSPEAMLQDAVWSYENPHKGMEAIAGHLAFYPSKVTVQRL